VSDKSRSAESDRSPARDDENRSSVGDIDRVLWLLWRRSLTATNDNRRGPSRRLNVEAIIDAAIHLCDIDGLPNLTMRNLAQHLSVKPMTLYTYMSICRLGDHRILLFGAGDSAGGGQKRCAWGPLVPTGCFSLVQ
jgi:hypothetical protein